MRNLILFVMIVAAVTPAMAWNAPQSHLQNSDIAAAVAPHQSALNTTVDTSSGTAYVTQLQNQIDARAAAVAASVPTQTVTYQQSHTSGTPPVTTYTTEVDVAATATATNNAQQAAINSDATIQGYQNTADAAKATINSYSSQAMGPINEYLAASGSYGTSYKTGYATEVAQFDAFFLKDLKDGNGTLPFTMATYISDLGLAANSNTPPPTVADLNQSGQAFGLNADANVHQINGDSATGSNTALDSSLATVQNRSLKISIEGGGIDNRWYGQTLLALLNRINAKLGQDVLLNNNKGSSAASTLSDQLNFFTQTWAQSLETTVMSGITSNNTTGFLNNGIGQNKELILDGSGILTDNTNSANNVFDPNDPDQVASYGGNNDLKNSIASDGHTTSTNDESHWGTNYDVSNSDYAATDMTFNSRQWSQYGNCTYGEQNGVHTIVRLTTNGTTYELHDLVFTSPIVLDMNGDGRLEASNGEWLPHQYKQSKMVEFDIDGDGFMDLTEWVGPNDGLLVQYNEKEEMSAHQLFGEADGYKDGYEKLSLLDVNNDGQLSGDELKTLSVWQDANTNGKVDKNEIHPLSELGITSINIKHNNYVSSFTRNGKSYTMWDWYPTVMRVNKIKNN